VYSLCSDCIEDPFLRAKIGEEYISNCSLCGKEKVPVLSSSSLARILEILMIDRIELGMVVTLDDHGSFEQQGSRLQEHVSDVIQRAIEQEPNEIFIEEVVSKLVGHDHNPRKPGEPDDNFYCDDCNYEVRESNTDALFFEWKSIEVEIRQKRRFFNDRARDFYKNMFEGLHNMYSIWSEGTHGSSVLLKLPVDTNLFRARACNSEQSKMKMKSDPVKQIGPPPSVEARAGRMNAEGVPALYTSLDSETCLAEMRPSIGSETAVAMLKTTEVLTVLDFSLLDDSINRDLSYFDPDYDNKNSISKFLTILHEIISQPIVPGRETDYLITQTLAEYLAYVSKLEIDGLLFKSVQNDSGLNLVVFLKKGIDHLPVSYAIDSLKFYKTKQIEYEHQELEDMVYYEF